MPKLSSKKVCCVFSCENSSRTVPKKIMFVVPDAKRTEWLAIAGDRNYLVKRKHICEDHFNLPEDLENYTKFISYEKLDQRQDARAKWKHYVVPHYNVPYPHKMEPIKTEVVVYPQFKRNTKNAISDRNVDPTEDSTKKLSFDSADSGAVDDSRYVQFQNEIKLKNTKQSTYNDIMFSHVPGAEMTLKCRFCLAVGNNFTNLFNQTEFDLDRLCSLAKITASENDGLTEKICLTCLEKCTISIKFLFQIKRIDKILRKEFNKHEKRKLENIDEVLFDATNGNPMKSEQSDDEPLAVTEAWLLNDIGFCEEDLKHISRNSDESMSELKLKRPCEYVENESESMKRRKYKRKSNISEDIHSKCDLCHEVFTKEPHYNKHINNKVAKNQCLDCSSSFYSDDCLSNHREANHKYAIVFNCKVCDKVFYTEKCLLHHKSVHRDKKSFLCHICSKGFTNKCHLNLHLEKHDRTNCKSYECRVCNETFFNDWQIKAHLNNHLKCNELKCDSCILVFKSTLHYARHMNLHQKDEEMFRQCNSPQCERSNKRNCNLLTEEIRKEILISFWRLPTIEDQKKFTSDHVKSVEPFRRYVDFPKTARTRTNLYYLPIKNELIQVCKETFLNTLNLTDKVLHNWTAFKR